MTGEFDRERTTDTVTVPARSGDTNGTLRIVLPAAEPGTDEVTATAVNSRLGKRLSVEGSFGTETPYGTGSAFVRYGGSAVYTGVMRTDAQGIVVTYTEEDDPHVVFDVNGGVWRDTEPFMHMYGDVYILESAAIQDHGGSYEPADPERGELIFIGWTTNADVAAHTDFSTETAVSWGDTTVTPNAGETVLDRVRSDYLWDFTAEPPYDAVLYAVWSDAVTVTFDVVYNGNKLHTWNGPSPESAEGTYVFYESAPGMISYTLAKGDRVPRPADPSPYTANNTATWNFIRWLY